MCEWYIIYDKDYDGAFSIYNFYGRSRILVCYFSYDGKDLICTDDWDGEIEDYPEFSLPRDYDESTVNRFDPFSKDHNLPGLESFELYYWIDWLYPDRGDIYRYWV